VIVRVIRAIAILTAAVLGTLACLVGAASATVYVPISGAGSTWSENAITAWAVNIKQNNGINVSYSGMGSSDGRQQFRNGTVDFAVSEIPYGKTDNGVIDPIPARKLAYLPIVAGGTSFMYHLDSGGKRINNLRLDGQTVTKIFTGIITEWNYPEIKAENPGIALPARKIIPVVRSDGSGTTAQLTTWFASQYGSIWDAYCRSTDPNRPLPCGTTSTYPVKEGDSSFVRLSLSTGVAGYVKQDTGEGAITYVEYSYANNLQFPVAKLLNKGGYYIEPTQWNVAVALTKAQINPDLTQNLENVYTYDDPRTYPLSSYSYMIVPMALEAGFSTDKGRTLGEFVYYFLCTGQRSAGSLGYSPLPVNLVTAGFNVLKQVPGVDLGNRTTDYSTCQNPTFNANGGNNLAILAKPPAACDKQGSSQCAADGVTPVPGGGGGSAGGSTGGSAGGSTGGTTGGSSGGSSGGSTIGGGTVGGATGGSSGGGSGGGQGGGGSTGGGGAAAGGAGGTSASASIDPDTGKAVTSSGGGTGGGAQIVANPVSIGSGISDTFQQVLMATAAALLLGLAVIPPALSRRLSRGRSDGEAP
jgi:phosphate ABC transporter phosphate-binding protein